MSNYKVKFFGGAGEVGRSSIFLKDYEDNKRFLLDNGIKLNHTIEYPIGIPNVDVAILSHAHLDHSGFFPALYIDQNIPWFGTPPSFDLSFLLLKDSIKIEKKRGVEPKFHNRQLKSFTDKFIALDYHKTIPFGNYDITFYDAGHIPGSAITSIQKINGANKYKVVYTGDFKIQPQMMHTGAEIVESDILIIESTYASKEHPDREELIKNFIREIKETLDNKGNALVPAFAVGRSQELLMILHKNGLIESTYLDGMGKDAANIILKYPNYINNADLLRKAVDNVNMVNSVQDRKEALSKPSIILTTSGMLSGGPVLDYITKINKSSHIFLTGYQTEETNGRTLLESHYVTIKNKKITIPQKVSFYDFSAHAGRSDLFEYVKRSNPTFVICQHGDPINVEIFADELRGEGFDAFAPRLGESVEI